MFKSWLEDKKKSQNKQTEQPPDDSVTASNQIKIQEMIVKLEELEDVFNNKIKELSQRIDKLKENAKQLVREKRLDNAKEILKFIQIVQYYFHQAEEDHTTFRFLNPKTILQSVSSNKMASLMLGRAASVLYRFRPLKLKGTYDKEGYFDDSYTDCENCFEELDKAENLENQEYFDQEIEKLEVEIIQEDALKLKLKILEVLNDNSNTSQVNQQVETKPSCLTKQAD